jgi:hypothetical protein
MKIMLNQEFSRRLKQLLGWPRLPSVWRVPSFRQPYFTRTANFHFLSSRTNWACSLSPSSSM